MHSAGGPVKQGPRAQYLSGGSDPHEVGAWGLLESLLDLGEVAEWPNVPDSKSGVPQGTVGSNPTLSAKNRFDVVQHRPPKAPQAQCLRGFFGLGIDLKAGSFDTGTSKKPHLLVPSVLVSRVTAPG